MKKLPLLLLLALAGCHVKIDDPATPSQKQTVAASSYTPPVVPETPQAEPQKKAGYNPSRIHQLYDLPTAKITVDGHPLTVWLMTDESTRQEGMMFLKDADVKPDQGMLFVFKDSDERGFWMSNTLIPLDVAYIAPNKKVISVAQMKALDLKTTPSHGKAQFVLEMKQGTIQRLGIRKGSEVSIPDSIKATE